MSSTRKNCEKNADLPRLALFASGNGTNVSALFAAVAQGALHAQIVALICDNYQAPVIARAQAAHCPLLVLNPHDAPSRLLWEQTLVDFLNDRQVEWIALAGFMRIVGPELLQAFPHRIVNIHPALLPLFPGRHGIEEAYRAQVKETGVTIHYVDAGIDTGTIIAQAALTVDPKWSLDELSQRIHQLEHRLYPKVLEQLMYSNENLERMDGK